MCPHTFSKFNDYHKFEILHSIFMPPNERVIYKSHIHLLNLSHGNIFMRKVIEVKIREPKKPRDPSTRPSADEPLGPLTVNVTPSLKQALEKHMENLSLQVAEGRGCRRPTSNRVQFSAFI